MILHPHQICVNVFYLFILFLQSFRICCLVCYKLEYCANCNIHHVDYTRLLSVISLSISCSIKLKYLRFYYSPFFATSEKIFFCLQ
ncbi:hypothetical protein DFJ63DRAFT_318953 [Scheffersomyces coipomensis]|uniref:uncharacterized protein n=1 Tax=Scheffersomyces coipomensis TaxID=1788519 RepID=UPI00315DA661